MPTAQISSPACLSAITTSAPSIPLANSWNKVQSLSRKGETESRRPLVDFFTAHPRDLDVTCKTRISNGSVRLPEFIAVREIFKEGRARKTGEPGGGVAPAMFSPDPGDYYVTRTVAG